MNFCRKVIFFVALLSGSIVHAKSFSLQIIQKNGSENVVFNASYLIEQTILDYFFEHAYIVSNSPVIIEKKDGDLETELKKSIAAAQEGFLDYIIEVEVFYNLENSNNPEEAMLSNIEKIKWNVVSLSGRTVLAGGEAVPQKRKLKNDDDSLVFFTNEIAQSIQKGLETKGGRR